MPRSTRNQASRAAQACIASALATLALAFPAGAGAVEAGGGSSLASGGLVIDSFSMTPSYERGFVFTFVAPSGTCVGGSLIPGVDLCKPWAALQVAFTDGRGGLTGQGATICESLTNPTSWSDGYPVMNPKWGAERPIKPRSGIYVDVPCEGGGYDFYRFAVDDTVDEEGRPWGLFNGEIWGVSGTSVMNSDPMTWTWGDYNGSTSIGHDNGAHQSGYTRVYGYDAQGPHLIAGGGADSVFPVAANIVTTLAEAEGR